MTAIKSKFDLNNRANKRKFRNEATRAAEFLQHIVDDFCNAIIEAPDQFTYDLIYKRFHNLWTTTCKHMLTVQPKFKVITINEEFFADEYASYQKDKKKFDEPMQLFENHYIADS